MSRNPYSAKLHPAMGVLAIFELVSGAPARRLNSGGGSVSK